MRRTFDDLERAVLKLLAKHGSWAPDEGTGQVSSGKQVPTARGRTGEQREAAELIRRAVKRLKST